MSTTATEYVTPQGEHVSFEGLGADYTDRAHREALNLADSLTARLLSAVESGEYHADGNVTQLAKAIKRQTTIARAAARA